MNWMLLSLKITLQQNVGSHFLRERKKAKRQENFQNTVEPLETGPSLNRNTLETGQIIQSQLFPIIIWFQNLSKPETGQFFWSELQVSPL